MIGMFKCDYFRGHTGAVLCLDHTSSLQQPNFILGANLLSGSEDKTCRLWDLRSQRTSLCMICPGEVLSVAFEPTEWVQDGTQNETKFGANYFVYAAVENTVLGFDLRNASSPILKNPTTTFVQAADEVNQVLPSKVHFSPLASRKSKSHNKNSKRHSQKNVKSDPNDNPLKDLPTFKANENKDLPNILIAADDTGSIHVLKYDVNGDLSCVDEKFYCHGSDESPSMVTAIALRHQNACFDPSKKSNQHGLGSHQILASGGTDCRIKLWDIHNSKRQHALQSIEITNSTSGAKEVCNPPMVHNMSWSPSGRLLAGALGDGSVVLFQLSSTDINNCAAPLVMTTRLEDAHSSAVACCLFPEWKCIGLEKNENKNVVLNDRLLCTAGNDCNIVFWDLGATICGDQAINPATFLDLKEDCSASCNIQNLRIDDSAIFDQPKTLFALQHPFKPNWMTSSRGQDLCFPSTIFVADTSANISAYTIPMQF